MKAKKAVQSFLELDKKDRKMYMLQVTAMRTFGIAILKLFLGLIYMSVWFFINGIFYAILAISKYRSVRDYKKIKKVRDKKAKKRITYSNYLYNGWLLVLLGIAYFIINLIIFKTGKTNNDLDGYLVYLTALLSFSSLVTAIISLKKYRTKHDPIVAAACQGNIAKALTSVVLTQVTLLDEFGPKTNRIVKIDGITGMIVGIIIIALGLRMVSKITIGGKDNAYIDC